MKQSLKQQKRTNRRNRIRKSIKGTSNRPRLSVFRSANHVYASLINDENNAVLVSASDKEVAAKQKKPVEIAKEVGKALAKKALSKHIETVVFDRAGYQYHGSVKAIAEGAREGGLKF